MRNKKTKKYLSLLLAVFMLVALLPATSALADDTKDTVTVSEQKLMVNGTLVEKAQVYNINGNNYFQLREIAALLAGSNAPINVKYDDVKNAVYVNSDDTTPYELRGDELTQTGDPNLVGTAQKTKQAIYINDSVNESISVYNIGGSNYFKLRDLGEALGFTVGYAEAARTMHISTSVYEHLLNCAKLKVFTVENGSYVFKLREEDGKLLLTTDMNFSPNSFKSTLVITEDSIKSGAYEADGVVTTGSGNKVTGHAKFDAKNLTAMEISGYTNSSTLDSFKNLMISGIKQALEQLNDANAVFGVYSEDNKLATTFGADAYSVESLGFPKA